MHDHNRMHGTLAVKLQEAGWLISPTSELQAQHVLLWTGKIVNGESHSNLQ